jgi:plasmid maintenance system antidote protein VapI
MDKNSINNRFSEAIKYLTNHIGGISKGDIAELLDLKSSTFSEILKGRMNVATDHIAKLTVSYDISPEWLLTGKGAMIKNDQKNDPGFIANENTKLVRDLIDKNEALSLRLGEQVNENAHLREKNMQLQSQINELKKEQNKSTKRYSVYSNPDIAAESEQEYKRK